MNKLTITQNSSAVLVDKAFERMKNTFRAMILDACQHDELSLEEAVRQAFGKENFTMRDFLSGGKSLPSGKDFDLLMSYFQMQQRFAQNVPVVLSSSVSYFKQVPIPHPGNAVPPEGFDRAACEVLAVVSWFYQQATKRVLEKGA